MKNRDRKLPKFKNEAEFIRFVETHDLADYWDEFEEVAPPVLDPKLVKAIDRRARNKKLISIRLEGWQLSLAKAKAAKEGVPYQSVIRRWISEGIRRAT
jgi:predicted DNA binding CopG/RHH family protein